MDTPVLMLLSAVGGNLLTVGAVYGMMKKTQDFHGEKFLEHALKLRELDENKVDRDLHDLSIEGAHTSIQNVAHRVSNLDQRVHGLEVKR